MNDDQRSSESAQNASAVPEPDSDQQEVSTVGPAQTDEPAGAPESAQSPKKLEEKPPSSSRKLFNFLKDAKELIAIIVFFATGTVLIYTTFATKKYVGNVRCLLGATIERIDNEAQSRELKSEIIENGIRLAKIRGRQPLTAVDIVDSEKLSTHIEDLKNKKRLADSAIKDASQRILNGECEK